MTAWLGAADSRHPRGIDPEDLHPARTVILWGTNTFVTNRHLWATIEQACEAGAEVIVVDPVRTATAEQPIALQLRPGTDVALVAGLIHVMDRDGLLDPTWLAEHTTDATDLLVSVADATPLTTEARTGIAADEVVPRPIGSPPSASGRPPLVGRNIGAGRGSCGRSPCCRP